MGPAASAGRGEVGTASGVEVCARQLPLVEWAPALAALGLEEPDTDTNTDSTTGEASAGLTKAGVLPFVDILTMDQVSTCCCCS